MESLGRRGGSGESPIALDLSGSVDAEDEEGLDSSMLSVEDDDVGGRGRGGKRTARGGPRASSTTAGEGRQTALIRVDVVRVLVILRVRLRWWGHHICFLRASTLMSLSVWVAAAAISCVGASQGAANSVLLGLDLWALRAQRHTTGVVPVVCQRLRA